jgi:hypothetical protein
MWLWVANVAARAGMLLLVGLFTFFGRSPGAGLQGVQIATFAIGAVILLGTALAGRDPARRRRLPLLPWAYGLVIVTASAATVTRSGGNMLALAALAAISAGSDLDAVTGWVLAAAGTLSFELVGLVGAFP